MIRPQFTDRNGDHWELRSDGFMQRGGRILLRSTVERELGPLVAKATHGAPMPFDESVRRAHNHAADTLSDMDKVQRARKLAFELERDPYHVRPENVADAIRKALGEL